FTFDVQRGFVSSAQMKILNEAMDDEFQATVSFDIDVTRREGNPLKLEAPKAAPNPPPKVAAETPKRKTPTGEPAPREEPGGESSVKPAKSETPTNYLKVVSTPGDYIGQGKSYEYAGEQLKVNKSTRAVGVSVDGWSLSIRAPKGEEFKVGEYRG